MYAIFEDGGRQYKVSEGDKIYLDRRDLSEGQETIEFDQVLAEISGVLRERQGLLLAPVER